jgi:hypothetical protein
MPGWEVRSFRRTAIQFRGARYFVAAKEKTRGGFRYVLEPWPEGAPGADDLGGAVVEYDEGFVRVRDGERVARAAASGVHLLLVPLYPLIGFLPGAVKQRLEDGYGVSAERATAQSLVLEAALALAMTGMLSISSVAGVVGGAFGIDAIPWLEDLRTVAAVALCLFVPDLVMRYTRILSESRHPYGFWEWLFRRQR